MCRRSARYRSRRGGVTASPQWRGVTALARSRLHGGTMCVQGRSFRQVKGSLCTCSGYAARPSKHAGTSTKQSHRECRRWPLCGAWAAHGGQRQRRIQRRKARRRAGRQNPPRPRRVSGTPCQNTEGSSRGGTISRRLHAVHRRIQRIECNGMDAPLGSSG